MRSLRPLTFAAALVALSLPVLAHADAPKASLDPSVAGTVTRLLEAKGTMRWNYDSRDGRYGHAEALVAAPADKVAKAAFDFNRYRDLHRKFATARVIGKDDRGTDVYMRYPVQIGPMKIEFYEVMRFGLPRSTDASHVLEGTGIKGDMKQGRTVITVKAVSPTHSLLQIDVLLVPKIPAPQSMIDEELRDGAFDFVDNMKHRVQGWVGPVTAL